MSLKGIVGWACLLALAPAAFAADAPALRGVEAGDLDRSVAPCADFYEFANGAWRAANPIPPSMVRWSRRWAAGEAAKDQLNAILDQVSASTSWPKGSVEQLIGDHYASCMDEARVETLGLEPDPSPPRRDRRPDGHRRRAGDDPAPARARDSRALRPHRLVGQPPADPGHRRRLRLGPRAARPRLLREERAALPGGAREVPRPRGARDRAGRGEPRGFPTGGGRRLRHGEAARGGVARQRGAARPEGHRPQDHLRRADEPRPELRLAGVLRRREAPPVPRERPAARVHEGHGPALPRDPPRLVEGVPQVAPAPLRRPLPPVGLREGELRLRGAVPRRGEGDEAAVEAVRGVHGRPARRGPGPEVRREALPARGAGPHAGAREEPAPGHGRHDPGPRVDEPGDQGQGPREARDLQPEDRLSRQVEGLLQGADRARHPLGERGGGPGVERAGRPQPRSGSPWTAADGG